MPGMPKFCNIRRGPLTQARAIECQTHQLWPCGARGTGLGAHDVYFALAKAGEKVLNAQRLGFNGEKAVAWTLRAYGRKVNITTHRCPYDLFVDEKVRVETKVCAGRQKKIPAGTELIWQFNIHRHGRMPIIKPDVYILRLEGLPKIKSAVHLLLPWNTDTKTFYCSFRSLINQRFSQQVDDFYHFARTGMVHAK